MNRKLTEIKDLSDESFELNRKGARKIDIKKGTRRLGANEKERLRKGAHI